MLKKIALASVFAVVSVVSFTASSVNAANPSRSAVPSVKAPVMNGICMSVGCH